MPEKENMKELDKLQTGNTKQQDGAGNAAAAARIKLPVVSVKVLDDYVKPPRVIQLPTNYYHFIPKTSEELNEQVDYDMDEEVSVTCIEHGN